MEHLGLPRCTSSLTVQVRASTLKFQLVPPQIPQEISLKFRVETKCRHFQVAHDNTVTSFRGHKSRKLPFPICQLPIDVFEHNDSRALQHYLLLHFANYRDFIDAKNVADEIRCKWIEIRENADLNTFGRVFPLTVTLKLWNAVMFYERRLEDGIIVHTRNHAIEIMLKRVQLEEIEADQSCVICLEELKKKKNSIVGMPCLHIFHQNCIIKWLENSNSCPICRFQMPSN